MTSGQTADVGTKKRGLLYWLNLIVFALSLLVVGYVAITLYTIVAPSRSNVCCRTPEDLGFTYQAVTIETDDGVELKGWYIPSENGAVVIMMHGYGGNRMSVLDLGGVIASEGYGVLLYDARASGESGGPNTRPEEYQERIITFLQTHLAE